MRRLRLRQFRLWRDEQEEQRADQSSAPHERNAEQPGIAGHDSFLTANMTVLGAFRNKLGYSALESRCGAPGKPVHARSISAPIYKKPRPHQFWGRSRAGREIWGIAVLVTRQLDLLNHSPATKSRILALEVLEAGPAPVRSFTSLHQLSCRCRRSRSRQRSAELPLRHCIGRAHLAG